MRKMFKILSVLFFSVLLIVAISNVSFADTCDHDYKIDFSVVNSDGHSVVCSKCGDKKNVDHTFNVMYDGISNNQCKCGYNKKANIYIYDEDSNLLLTDTLNTFSKINIDNSQIVDTTKFTITSFDEYEYIPKDNDYSNTEYSWELVESVDKLPDTINNVSLKFIVHYTKKAGGIKLGGGLFGDPAYTYDNSSEYHNGVPSADLYDKIVLNQVITLKDIEVKMTQNNDNYTFKITANGTARDDLYSKFNNLYVVSDQSLVPLLYKSANFGNKMDIYYKSGRNVSGTYDNWNRIKINGTYIKDLHYTQYDYGSTPIVYDKDENNGDKYFIPKEFANNNIGLSSNPFGDTTYNGGRTSPAEVVLNSNNSSLNGVNYYVSSESKYKFGSGTSTAPNPFTLPSFDCSITIKKTEFSNYRYLCFGSSSIAGSTYNFGTTGAIYAHGGYALCTDTLDLNNYTNCDHEWVVISDSGTKHKIKCSKCEWEKEENHSFIYEYDGMNNNVCICGKKIQVKMHYAFNSNLVSDFTDTKNINTSYTAPSNPTKTGYKFKNYSKYSYDYTTLSTTSTILTTTDLGETTTLPTNTGDKSLLFNANYDPIKYKLNFNTENNLNIPTTATISELVCEYDSEYDLPIMTSLGYAIQGYAIATKSNVVDLLITSKVKNLTINDNDIFELYPVFDHIKYTFKFNNENNLNLPITATISDLVCYYDSDYNFPNHIDVFGYKFLGWSLATNSNVISFGKNEHIFNYTTEANKIINVYPMYKLMEYTINCEYICEKATKSIIMPNVKCLSNTSLPKLTTLPTTAKVDGWFYNNNKLNSSNDIDRFIKDDNETIKIFYKVEDGASSYSSELDGINDINDIKFKIQYNYNYWGKESEKFGTHLTNDLQINDNSNLISISYFTTYWDSKTDGYKAWFCKGSMVGKVSDVGKLVSKNNEIIDVDFKFVKDTKSGGGGSGGSGGGGGNEQFISDNGKKITNIDNPFNDINNIVFPEYLPYIKPAIKNNPQFEEELKDSLIKGFSLTEADLMGNLSDMDVYMANMKLNNISYVICKPVSPLDRFMFNLKNNRVLFISLLVFALIVAIVFELWYYNKLAFLRRNDDKKEQQSNN